jgi:hypothetical protein
MQTFHEKQINPESFLSHDDDMKLTNSSTEIVQPKMIY